MCSRIELRGSIFMCKMGTRIGKQEFEIKKVLRIKNRTRGWLIDS
jgi:hypothetical protein